MFSKQLNYNIQIFHLVVLQTKQECQGKSSCVLGLYWQSRLYCKQVETISATDKYNFPSGQAQIS